MTRAVSGEVTPWRLSLHSRPVYHFCLITTPSFISIKQPQAICAEQCPPKIGFCVPVIVHNWEHCIQYSCLVGVGPLDWKSFSSLRGSDWIAKIKPTPQRCNYANAMDVSIKSCTQSTLIMIWINHKTFKNLPPMIECLKHSLRDIMRNSLTTVMKEREQCREIG